MSVSAAGQDFVVGLIHPFLKEAKNKNRLKFRESLALGYLSAALHGAKIRYKAINAEMLFLGSEEAAAEMMSNPDIKLVGISCKSQRTFKAGTEIAHFIKEKRPDIHITVGGVLATAADTDLLKIAPNFDSVVRGEGEEAIVELAIRVREGKPLHGMPGLTFRDGDEVVRNTPRSRIKDLNSIRFPLRDDLQYALTNGGESEASAYIVASRGCYAACTFCSIHQIYGDRAVVRRSPENIVAEMENLISEYSVRRFSFVDDIFLIPSKKGVRWIEEFCDILIEKKLGVNFYAEMRADTLNQDLLKKLRTAGMHRVFIGFEAGVDSVLERWDKGTKVADNNNAIEELKKSDFKYHEINMGYIMFDPEMTMEELTGQYDWVKRTGLAKVQHLQNRMNIYVGTPHYDRMIAQGRTNTVGFGDRWEIGFDNPGVAFVERALRQFHRRFEEEASENLLRAKEMFRSFVKVHDDLTAGRIRPKWIVELVSSAHRRLERQERALYFHVFEKGFAAVDSGVLVTPEAEAYPDRFWNSIQHDIQQVDREAVLLLELIAQANQIKVVGLGKTGKTLAALAPGEALVDGSAVSACISSGGGAVTYSSSPVERFVDRYDNNCQISLNQSSILAATLSFE